MRRVLAVLLCIVILLPSICVGVSAEENYTFYKINIDAGSGAIVEKAIVKDGEIYISADSFSNYTRFFFDKESKTFLIKGQEQEKAFKSVVIDVVQKKMLISGKEFCDLTNLFEVEETLFLPFCQMLPILNADIYEIKDGVIYVSNNKLSLAEVLYDFDISDYYFNIATEFCGIDLAAWVTIVPNYVLDTVVNMRFDRLDIVYNYGEYNDYKEAFSELLADDNLYLKAMATNPSDMDPIIEFYNWANKTSKDMKSVYEWIEKAGESKISSEKGGALFELLKEYYDSGELEVDDLKGLNDAWTSGKISFGDGIELLSYAYTHATLVEDNRQMLNAVYTVDTKISQKEIARKAAKQVYELYGENIASALYKEIAAAVASDTLEDSSPIVVYTKTAKLAGVLLENYMPFKSGEVAKLPVYSDIVISASSKYYSYNTLTDESTQNLRLSLLLCMLASRNCYEIMADVLEEDNSYYKAQMEKIEQIIMALYIAEENTEFDSFEHFEEYKKNNLKKIETSKLINDLEEYQLTEKEALEIATELISKCETYQNMGVVCELEFYDGLSSEERDAIWEMVSEDVKGAYGGEPMKSMCCKTYEEAKRHVYGCIDSSLASNISDAYVTYNDDLFFFMGNVGSITYKDVILTKFDECEINAIANLYNSGDMLCDTYCFIIKKTDTDNYIVSDIKLVDNTTNDTTENDITPIQTDWAQLYKQLLLGFSKSKYAEYYTDQTIPVLFDIDNDQTPELFVFCGIGANLLIEKCIMFQIRNNKIEAYYCDNLYYGSGSCDHMKLYKDKNGELFLLLTTFEVEVKNKEGMESYGNSLVKVSFNGERIVSEEIASNLGSNFMGDDDVFSFKNEIFNDFDSYYFAVSDYISSLDEMNTKNSSKNERSNVFPIGLYGISVDDIDKLFHAYMNS